MGAPITGARIIAGLITTAVGGFFMKGRMERSELWDLKHDSFEREFDHNYMLAGHKMWSGTGLESNIATWEKHKHNGPWGLFKLGRQWKHKITGFFKDVIWDPSTALVIGGIYLAGMKPHKLIMATGRAIKDSGMIQRTGAQLLNWGKTFFNGKFTKAAFAKLFTLPGLALAGAAVFAILQFEKVYNGNEQKDMFGNK